MRVRIALFGDIHGNAVALRAVLADIKEVGADQSVCLGDVAFRGPQPDEVFSQLLEAKPERTVVGNTDQWLFRGFPAGFAPPPERMAQLRSFRSWALEHIDQRWLDEMSHFPLQYSRKLGPHSLTVVHSSPRSTEDWYAPSGSDEELLPIFEGADPCDILVYGHVHTPFIRRINRRWLINTGSVGHPTDGDYRASYVLLAVEKSGLRIEIRRVPYDVDAVDRAAKEREFPHRDEYIAALRAGFAL